MTAPDPGPERSGFAAETRQIVERARTHSSAHVSARAFWIAFAAILLAIALFALILRQT
jgi:hypothetical protein